MNEPQEINKKEFIGIPKSSNVFLLSHFKSRPALILLLLHRDDDSTLSFTFLILFFFKQKEGKIKEKIYTGE